MTWSKGGNNNAKDYGGYQGWSYWRGAVSPGNKGNKGRGKAPWQDKQDYRQSQPKKGTFPHYDALPKSERQNIVEIASSSNAGGYVSELQKAVNVARKAEQRVKRLAGEKRDRVQQWRDYEAELKRCYSSEKQRFRSALQKLERDETEAVAEQAAARENLRKVAVGQTAEPEDTHMEILDQEFEMLTESAGMEPVQEEDTDAVIRRAMEATQAPAAIKLPPTAAVSTPLRRTHCQPMTPEGAYSAQLSAPIGNAGDPRSQMVSSTSPNIMASTEPFQRLLFPRLRSKAEMGQAESGSRMP